MLRMRHLGKSLLAGLLATVLLAMPAGASANFHIRANAPYNAPDRGLFHNQTVKAEGFAANYSLFLPDDLQPWRPAVMVLPPNDTSAKVFAESATGQEWIASARENNFAVAFLEAEQAGAWNMYGAMGARKEADYVKTLYLALRSKANGTNALFTMDKSHVSMVGYGEGGATALLVAAEWPAMLANVVSVDAPQVDNVVLKEAGRQLSFPFPADSMSGQQEIKLQNSKIPVPTWIISADSQANVDTEKYFIKANGAVLSHDNLYANTVYTKSDSPARVWATRGHRASLVKTSDIWDGFMSTNGRFLGYPGGTLMPTIDFSAKTDGSGYHITETNVNGFVRRWMTYVPVNYLQNRKDVPMVLALHGYSASMYALAEESRWADVADKYGFIVVFAQGYPNQLSNSMSAPVPAWNSGLFPMDNQYATNDVKFLQHVIAQTEENYRIDESRIYGTGHSNGSSMTWQLTSNQPGLFAAVAPIGYTQVGTSQQLIAAKVQVPSWSMKGQFDVDMADSLAPDSTNAKMLDYWTAYNGITTAPTVTTSGRFTTRTYTDENKVPLVKFTSVSGTPHAYFPDQSWMIWELFFSKYSRDADGTVQYRK